MILTPLKIQVAIIKAFYSLALKSVKYYGGLVVGINNTCLFKEIRLLRSYIDILKNFTIVGSTITCSCCIEGDYTVLLNELSELTEAKIQFGCDNSGSMYYDEISYPFTYFYDSNNQKIEIKFSTLLNPSTDEPYVLNLDGVEFTDNCSFEPNTISPIEVAVINEVTGTPVTADNIYAPVPNGWNGNITIYNPDDTVLDIRNNPLPISVDIIDNPQEIVNEWNSEGPEDWLLLYDGTQYTMLTPFDGTDYSGYKVIFSQYEGGADSLAIRTSFTFMPEPFVTEGTRAYTFIDIPNTFVGSVPATSVIEPAIPQPFITTPTLATAELVIPDTIFSTVQTPATMTIVIKDVAMFGTVNPTNQFFVLNSSLMFSHVGAYANPAALVSGFNSNNGNGFVMSYVGPSPTTSGLSIFEIESPISGQPFNGDVIKIIYTGAVSNQPITGTFSGGTSVKPLSLTISDDFGLAYDVLSPSFSSVADFVADFNATVVGYTLTLGTTDPGFSYLIFTPSGPFTFAYNDTSLTFIATDPSFLGGVYSNSADYQGGIDTTECTYTLKLYDLSNTLILPVIENSTPTIYTSIADIATDIQNNPTNTYVFGTGVNTDNKITTNFPYEFELPQSLVCETYNGYYFALLIEYTSSQYTDYPSEFSYIEGGINAVSNQFEISDSASLLFTRTAGSYNYPNGSEITVGLINDFNDNNPLYEAEYVEPGPNTPETLANVTNNFLSELTSQGITFGQEVHAYIDSIDNEVKYLGKYQAPLTGVLPPYATMISNLNSNIVSNNYVPGLTSSFTGSGIFQLSPPTQGGVFNGKLLQIIKIVYTPATVELTFGSAFTNTFYILRALVGDEVENICVYFQAINKNGTEQAALVASSINSSGTGYTATVVGNTVTVSALPYTGTSYNNVDLELQVYTGFTTINAVTHPADANLIIATFGGGLITPTPVKQVAFAGGVAPIPTSRVKFYSPIQPLTTPLFGTGNFAYNSEFFSYNYNSGEYSVNQLYSGGIDPTVGQFTAEILEADLDPYAILYTDSTPQNYANRQALINSFNVGPDNLDFQITLALVGSVIQVQFLAPPDSFSFFNNFIFRYSYNYVSSDSTGGQYTDYEDIDTEFASGVDPTLIPYEGTFDAGSIGTFVNDNPCEETIAEQECLTNNDVNKIIAHIDKLVK
jgi:hypothetical protein